MYREFDWDSQRQKPHQTLMKSSLSVPRIELLELMQSLRFGWVRHLTICDGEPVLNDNVAIIQNVKINGRNEPHPQLTVGDYVLKREVITLFAQLDALQNGEIEVLEVKDGLPFQLHIHRRHAWPPTVKFATFPKTVTSHQKLP